MTRYLWVAARRAEGFPTVLCCAAAGVSRQAFYDRRAAQGAAPTARESAEAAPVAEIREIHAASDRAYGSPRVTAELRDRGHRPGPRTGHGARTSPTYAPARAGCTWRSC